MTDSLEATASRGVITPGQVISERYRIVSKIAEGGMGEVYKGEHVDLGKAFAVKVIRAELSNDPDFAERFKREAIAASRIGHPNIVDVSDFGRTPDGRFYFVMEFLVGRTLTQLLKEQGALPAPRALAITLQMCRALEAAHQLGIVHRDLKPENILLLNRGGQADFVKVVDFGVAKVAEPGRSGYTSVGMVVGTPQYMSPEQAAGTQLDARTDIYSTGLMLYEMLAGLPPFMGETPSLVMAAHIYKEAPPLMPAPNVGAVPESLRDVVRRMLAKAPTERPGTMGEVISVLEAAQAELGVAGSGRNPIVLNTGMRVAAASGSFATEVVRPKKRIALVAGAAAAVLVVGLGVAFLVRGSSETASAAATVTEPEAEAKPAPSPTPAPAVAAKEETVKVSITTVPENAEILRGGALVGRTPKILTWKKGERAELKISLKGYEGVQQIVEPTEDLPLQFTLTRVASAKPKKRPHGQTDDGLMDSPY
jgi:serine/threonine-protein kinase